VETSLDGVEFAAAPAAVEIGAETRITLRRPAVARAVRLTQTGSDPEAPWSVFELAIFAQLGSGDTPFERAHLEGARLECHRPEIASGLPNVVDGDPATRWDSGRPQQGGEWLQLELPAAVLLGDLWLDTTRSANDYPRGLTVLHSLDGETFEPARIRQHGTARLHVMFDPPVRSRFLRLEQTGRHEQFYWSIHELELWAEGLSPAAAPAAR
jgi:hypothetical protein